MAEPFLWKSIYPLTYDRVSLKCYVLPVCVGVVSLGQLLGELGHWLIISYWHIFTGIYLVPVIAYLLFIHINDSRDLAIAWRSVLLGSFTGIGINLALCSTDSNSIFGTYLVFLSLFHFSEYFVTSIISPKTLNTDSFILNHSIEYTVAAISSWIEFFCELYFFPELKEYRTITLIGVALCVMGEALRKGAMLTAGSNFNHLVRRRREPGHELVTNGVYALCRHPSYAGWFMWSVGTQVILVNPICLVGYTIATWTFFKYRIEDEEITLIDFFGDDYIHYQRRVPTGIPFISGFRIDLISTSLDTTPD